jgi:hypothetical protein
MERMAREVFPLISTMLGTSFLKTSPKRIWFSSKARATGIPYGDDFAASGDHQGRPYKNGGSQ